MTRSLAGKSQAPYPSQVLPGIELSAPGGSLAGCDAICSSTKNKK